MQWANKDFRFHILQLLSSKASWPDKLHRIYTGLETRVESNTEQGKEYIQSTYLIQTMVDLMKIINTCFF